MKQEILLLSVLEEIDQQEIMPARNINEGGPVIVAEIQPSTIEAPRSSDDSNDTSTYFVETIAQVFLSKFVIGQLIFNVLASFLGPLGTFYLLFGFLSEGPYEWSSGPLVGVVVGSLLGSPILIFALMPVGLPEAVESGWFPRISQKSLMEELQQIWWLPSSFMMKVFEWRWATKRNCVISLMTGIVYVPIFLLFARFAFGPSLGTWTLIWFNVVYEVLLAIPILLLGLVGYALEENLEVTLDLMSDDPNGCRRLLKRVCISLRMTFWPY